MAKVNLGVPQPFLFLQPAGDIDAAEVFRACADPAGHPFCPEAQSTD